MEKIEIAKEISKRNEKKEFLCSICGTSFSYERYGKCKDAKVNLYMLEDVFSMRDPFLCEILSLLYWVEYVQYVVAIFVWTPPAVYSTRKDFVLIVLNRT